MIFKCQYCSAQFPDFKELRRHFERIHRRRTEYMVKELPTWMAMPMKQGKDRKLLKSESPATKYKTAPLNQKAETKTDKTFDDFLGDFCNLHNCPIWTECQGADAEHCRYWEEYKYKHGGKPK